MENHVLALGTIAFMISEDGDCLYAARIWRRSMQAGAMLTPYAASPRRIATPDRTCQVHSMSIALACGPRLSPTRF